MVTARSGAGDPAASARSARRRAGGGRGSRSAPDSRCRAPASASPACGHRRGLDQKEPVTKMRLAALRALLEPSRAEMAWPLAMHLPRWRSARCRSPTSCSRAQCASPRDVVDDQERAVLVAERPGAGGVDGSGSTWSMKASCLTGAAKMPQDRRRPRPRRLETGDIVVVAEDLVRAILRRHADAPRRAQGAAP